MASDKDTSHSVTPTPGRGYGGHYEPRKSDEGLSGLQRPAYKSSRSFSSGSTPYGARVAVVAATASNVAPGSFSSDLKSTTFSRSTTPRPDLSVSRLPSHTVEDDGPTISEQRQAIVRDKIAKEQKIKLGTENMLEALLAKNAKQTKDQRQKVEIELGTSNRKLAELRLELEEELQRAQTPITPPGRSTMSSYFRPSPLKSPSHLNESEENEPVSDAFEGESPTFVLEETLQALEMEGMQPDYYVDRANTLVELFKRHPTLKYDLAWSVFSLRVQMMLLSDSTEVIAAGYRLTRYAVADRASLKTIRSLHTDEMVILSLVKKGKAILEREQAVKFVRAFLDVKDGVQELSRAVVRTIVAVAEHNDDRLRNICLLTLTELLIKHPPLLIAAGGVSTLTDALAEGSFPAAESLVASFLLILDAPRRRKYLKGGRQLEAIFSPFTDPLIMTGHEERLKTCAKAISAMMKTWPGLLTLSRHNAVALRSLLDSLQYPSIQSRDLILELLFDVLRIKPPSWSSSFLAGRRLTTYRRLANLREEPSSKRPKAELEYDSQRFDLTTHFSALVLATLVQAGLVQCLSRLIKDEEDLSLRRKTTLLLTEVLKLSNHTLPGNVSSQIQVLPDLILPVRAFDSEDHASNLNMIYQIESISRTVDRSGGNHTAGKQNISGEISVVLQSGERSKYSATMDAEQFRQAMIDTQVPNHTQYIKWKWDVIHSLVEGPLTNARRLDEAIKSTKFLKRLVGFYRPFKYRFSMIRNTKPNQRYVRTGVALIKSLVQTSLGIQYLVENKLLRQVAECLAQVDRLSGLTSTTPLFDRHQMAETLSGGYFAIIGALSYTANGILMMERWHMINMFYHIIDLKDRNDLIRALLGSMDFSLDSHLRVMLSQSLTAGSKEIRLHSTKLLRKYVVDYEGSQSSPTAPADFHWVLRLLLTQLYDPDVEVCEVAVKILEEACNRRSYLEYVVKCRPSLDHLGEIGAPLLLRFLSTSVGYHYLHGLDYITQEMDDWFLGRNDSYVTLVEASLARAYTDQASQRGISQEDLVELEDMGLVPPHFYRELARTTEGCKLLEQSGHFYDFTTSVRQFKLNEEDPEALTRVKGCLWAIGNVGSMELGGPFLEESEIVGTIVQIAEGAEVISMRGTAYFVLGLISRSTHGLEMLAEHGWETAVNPRGESLGLCMPTDLGRLCMVNFKSASEDEKDSSNMIDVYKSAVTDPYPVNAKVLRLVVDLGNTVLYKKAVADLHLLKAQHPHAFQQVALFRKTLTILESHHIRLPPRQFVLDLFDKAVMRRIVLEDGDHETESDTG